MHPDIDITSDPVNGDSCITLRDPDRFMVATNLLGWTTNTLRAQNIGVEPVTVRRAMQGEPVGERFITRTVKALEPHRELLQRIGVEPTIDGLFEITTKAVSS